MVQTCITKVQEWCIYYEVDGESPSGRPKKTWKVVVEKDGQIQQLNKDAVN